MLRVVRLTARAQLPTKATPLSAGVDLYSAVDYEIKPQGTQLCETNLQIKIPDGYYGRIAPRSGISIKYSLQIGAGVIDNDYRGEIKVFIFNHGQENFKIARGDRIAQLILEKILIPEIVECTSLDTTNRGTKGFGSSGLQ